VFGVRVVDWAEDKEKAASIAANNQHLAGEFTDGLLDALGEMQTDLGEGFQAMNFDMLLNNIPTTLDPQGTNPTDEWEGMPEFVSDDNTSYRKIIVHFQSEEKVQEFAKLVAQQVTLRTKFLHFPRKEREERQWIGSEDEEPTT